MLTAAGAVKLLLGVEAPVAEFSATPLTGTTPLDVTFTDASTNTPTSWLWERDSGSGFATFSTSQSPAAVQFTTGAYDIRLTATNATGSDSETKVGYITVTSGAGSAGPTVSGSWPRHRARHRMF